jgi:hypothetical protein
VVKKYLFIADYVDSMDVKILSVVSLNLAGLVQLQETEDSEISIVSSCFLTFSKWHNATVSFPLVRNQFKTATSDGSFTTSLQTLAATNNATPLLPADATNATFGDYKVSGFKTSLPTGKPSSQPSDQPTGLPSGYPTAQPTSKPSQDLGKTCHLLFVSVLFTVFSLAKVIPRIEVRNISQTRSSITMRITFSSPPEFSGVVYCAALTAATTDVLTTSNYITSIILNGQSAPYFPKAHNFTTTINSLTPVTTYRVYCMVQNVIGLYTEGSDVISDRVMITTDCCHDLTFTSLPSFIYNDAALYGLASNKGKNVFTFALGTKTSSVLTITPALHVSDGTNMSQFKISPAAFTFSPSSSVLSGSFSLLLRNSSIPGDSTYNISLLLSGSAANDYYSPTAVFTVASLTKVPAPKLVSSLISNDAATLYINFDSATDYGGTSLSFACSKLFTFYYHPLLLLNDASTSTTLNETCLWTSSSSVAVSFTSAGVLSAIYANSTAPYNTVTLKAGKIHPLCTSPPCVSPKSTPLTTVSMSAPVNPLSPNIVLLLPSTVSGCSNVTIDPTGSTGNLGYDWSSITWGVEAPNGISTDAISSILNSYVTNTEDVIMIPSSILSSTSYYITLTITNIFGKTSSTSGSFSKSASGNIPTTKILGTSTISMKSKKTLSLTGVGQLSPCGVVNANLSYAWTIYDKSNNDITTSLASKITSKNPTTFSLAAYALTSASLYTVKLTVTSKTGIVADTASSSAIVSVQTKAGLIVAAIKGSSSLLISQSTTLDASSSYDEDVAATTASSSLLTYSWKCTSLNVNTYGDDCTDSVLVPGSPSITSSHLFINYTYVAPSSLYSFTVTANSTANGLVRTGTASVTVQTVAFSSADAKLSATASIIAPASTTVNQFQQFSLSGLISASLKSKVSTSKLIVATWEGYYSSITVDPIALTSIASTVPSAALNVTQALPLLNYAYSLVINAKSFDPRTTVTFRLSLSYNDSLMSYSEITYTVAGNPTGGTFAVAPAEGLSMSTYFTLKTYGWVDDASNLPLTYDFRYTWSNLKFTIQSVSQSNTASTPLPAGTNSSTGGNVGLILRVFNVYGGLSKVQKQVYVRTGEATASASTATANTFLTTTLSSAAKTGNTDAAVAAISIVGATLNTVDCSAVSADSCAALNRKPCSSTPQTCSSCLTGFSGVFGASNTKCKKKKTSTSTVTHRRALLGSTPESIYSEVNKGKSAHSFDHVYSSSAVVSPFGLSADDPNYCLSDDDCDYTCDLTQNACYIPVKSCPNDCSASLHQGECRYIDGNNHVIANTTCTVDNTYCYPVCDCGSGWYGNDCSLDYDTFALRESSRILMCSSLVDVLSLSNPSPDLIDSLSSSLLSVYNPYEVISEVGKDTCLALLADIISLAEQGYLDASQLPDSSGTTTVDSLWNVISSFIIVGNSSTALQSSISSLTKSILTLLADGQEGITLLSNGLKLSLNKQSFFNIIGKNFSVPTTEEEDAYGTSQPVILFTDNNVNELINSCLNYETESEAEANQNNINNYFTFIYGSWNSNPFPDASSFSSAIFRSETYTNNTFNLNDDSNNSSEVLFYITLPFISQQHFIDVSSEARFSTGVYNETFPICSEYSYSVGNASYFNGLCSSCDVSTYNNLSVTFECYDMKPLCGEPTHTSSGGSRRRRLASSSSSVGSNIYQFGTIVENNQYHISIASSFDDFHIDIAKSLPIFVAVGGIVILLLVGLIFFYQWDMNDYYVVKYSNRIKYPSFSSRLSSTIFDDIGAVGEAIPLEDEEDEFDEDGTVVVKKGKGLVERNVFSSSKGGKKSAANTSKDLLYILHNAFPAMVYQDNSALSGSLSPPASPTSTANRFSAKTNRTFSFSSKSLRPLSGKITEFLTTNDYSKLFNKENYLYNRFLKWIQVMIQVILLLFINTLFFYIFYPDRGMCEGYHTSFSCLEKANDVTGENLCIWNSNTVNVLSGIGSQSTSSSCILNVPTVSAKNIPFIMLLATITILVSMPVVIGLNLLLMNIIATVPASYLSLLSGGNNAKTNSSNRGVKGKEGNNGNEVIEYNPETDGANEHYNIVKHDSRLKRTPLVTSSESSTNSRRNSRKRNDIRSMKSGITAPSFYRSFSSPSSGVETPSFALLSYLNKIPVEEEIAVVLEKIELFYNDLGISNSTPYPSLLLNHSYLSPLQAKILMIYHSLGIDSNFNTVPLNFRQQLQYGLLSSLFGGTKGRNNLIYRGVYSKGSEGSSGDNEDGSGSLQLNNVVYNRIRSKLSQTRSESMEFLNFFAKEKEMAEKNQGLDNNNNNQISERDEWLINNIKILQFFIFEQFPIYQKYLLLYYFHNTYLYSNLHLFNSTSLSSKEKRSNDSFLWTGVVAPSLWLSKIGIFLGCLCYCVYFILNWCLISQGNTFENWGINYIIIIVEQLFIIQWIQHFYIQKLTSYLLLPKLQIIYSLLHSKMISFLSTTSKGQPSHTEGEEKQNEKGLLSFPFASSANATAMQTATSDDLPISQLLSPIARSCKDKLLSSFLIPQLINTLSDYDIYQMRYQLSQVTLLNKGVINDTAVAGRSSVALNNDSNSDNNDFAGVSSKTRGEGEDDENEEKADDNHRPASTAAFSSASSSSPSKHYKEIADWKSFSFFHICFVIIPLFMIQLLFQILFFFIPFSTSLSFSSAASASSFHFSLLNRFHLIYLNVLFAYIIPAMISLLVVAWYFFFENVPLPAFIVVIIVLVLLVIFVTPRKTTGKDLLYDRQRGGSGKRRGTAGGILIGEENESERRRSQRRRRHQGYGSMMSPLAFGDMFSALYSGLSSVGSYLLLPISSIYSSYLSYHETAAVVDQSWQRQNIPVFIQPSIGQSSPVATADGGAGGAGDSTDLVRLDEIYLSAAEERIGGTEQQQQPSPSADSYLMSLLMNHRDGLPLPPLYEEEDEEESDGEDEERDGKDGDDEENRYSSKQENAHRRMLQNNTLYQTKRLPNEIQSITAISSLKATLKKEKNLRNSAGSSSASTSLSSPFNKNYLSYLLSSSFELMDDKETRKKNEKILLSKLKMRKEDDLGKRRISSNASLSSRTNPLTDDAHPMDRLTPSLTLAPLNESDEHSFEKTGSSSSNEKESPLSGGMKEIDEEREGEEQGEQEFDSRTIHISTITSIKQLKFLFRFMVLEDSSRKATATGGHGQHHGYYNLYHHSTINPYIALLRALIIVLYHRPSSSASSAGPSSDSSAASSSVNFVSDVIGLSEHLIRVNRHGRPTSTSSLRITSPVMRRLADSITLDSSQLNTVLEQLLLLYTPASISLTMIERQEIIDEFYQFIIMNDFNWERIPLSSFMLWFLEMIDKIEKYKKVMKYGLDGPTSSSSSHHHDDDDEYDNGNHKEGERNDGNNNNGAGNNTSNGQSNKEQKNQDSSSSSSSSSYSSLSSSALMKRKFNYTRTYQQLRKAIALPTPSSMSSMKEGEEKEDSKSAEEDTSSSPYHAYLTSSPPSFKSFKQYSSRKETDDDLFAGRRPVLVSEISTRSTFEDNKEEEPAFVRPSRSNAVRQSIVIPSSPPAPSSTATEGEQQQPPQRSTPYTFAPRQFNKNTPPPAPAAVSNSKKESKEESDEGSPTVVVPPPAPASVPPVFSGVRNLSPVIRRPLTKNDHEDRATGDFSMGNPLRGLKKKNNTDSPTRK